jgi:hypothetical protein
MAFRTTPQLGPQLDEVIPLGSVWFEPTGDIISPQLGTRETGSDGHEYILVQASAAIAAAAAPGTAVTITEPAFTAATGAGGFTAPPAGVADDAFFWARKTAL